MAAQRCIDHVYTFIFNDHMKHVIENDLITSFQRRSVRFEGTRQGILFHHFIEIDGCLTQLRNMLLFSA